MSFYALVKKLVPTSIKRKRQLWKDARVQKRQTSRIETWMSRDYSADVPRVEARLIFDIHRLEKGLSHSKFKDGFGRGVLSEMAHRIQMLQKADSTFSENPIYQQALAVLHEYQKRNTADGYDLSTIRALFPADIWMAAEQYSERPPQAGAAVLKAREKENNFDKNFVTLAMERHSVREYSSQPVSQEILDAVYATAMKTPSVCNRQSVRVYEISNKQIIHRALQLQGGFNGYADPPVLLFITSDIRAFMSFEERNEPFVDGGLFSMSLLYALEAYGLAACPLNAMFGDESDKKTRKLLDIPDYELPIMYIAVGNFPESVPVCLSTRKNYREIVRILQ